MEKGKGEKGLWKASEKNKSRLLEEKVAGKKKVHQYLLTYY